MLHRLGRLGLLTLRPPPSAIGLAVAEAGASFLNQLGRSLSATMLMMRPLIQERTQ